MARSGRGGHRQGVKRRPRPDQAMRERFIAHYVRSLNATEAALAAGYSPKTAKAQGSRMLTRVDVAAEVARLTRKHLDKAELTAGRVLEEIRRIAFSDPRSLFDLAGNLKPIHQMTTEEAASIASFEVVKKNVTAGDGVTDTVCKVKVWDKAKALEMAAKHFALLTDRIAVDGPIQLAWKTDPE